MAGIEVNRQMLDQKAATTVIALREAFRNAENIFHFLGTVPANAPGGDPLTKPQTDPETGLFVPNSFGYSEDEAYLLRFVFESLHNMNYKPTMDAARNLTGLE